MPESVYIETSLVGYLAIRPSNNLILMANMEVTQRWWQTRRRLFDLYISQVVLDEAAEGDAEMSAKRIEYIQDIPVLELNEAVRDLGTQFIRDSNLPLKAADDAIHIATATVHGLDYLLTWNCKHIANAQIQRKLEAISSRNGYTLPKICTPYELMGA